MLILPSHLCLGSPISLPLTFYDQNVPFSHRLSTCVLHAPSISSSLICSQESYLKKRPHYEVLPLANIYSKNSLAIIKTDHHYFGLRCGENK